MSPNVLAYCQFATPINSPLKFDEIELKLTKIGYIYILKKGFVKYTFKIKFSTDDKFLLTFSCHWPIHGLIVTFDLNRYSFDKSSSHRLLFSCSSKEITK